MTVLATIHGALGDDWSDALDEAWRDGLEAISAVMMRAQADRGTAGARRP